MTFSSAARLLIWGNSVLLLLSRARDYCSTLSLLLALRISDLSIATPSANNAITQLSLIQHPRSVVRAIATLIHLSLPGEKWHLRRKLLSPTFHSGLLEVYLKIVRDEITVLISCLRNEVDNCFDILPYAKRAALDIICGICDYNNIVPSQNYFHDCKYPGNTESATTLVAFNCLFNVSSRVKPFPFFVTGKISPVILRGISSVWGVSHVVSMELGTSSLNRFT